MPAYADSLFDPRPRSRPVFGFHRPETVAEWLEADTSPAWLASRAGSGGVSETMAESSSRPSTFRARLQRMPPVHIPNLWPNKVEALLNLERSLADDRPRALIQMATGSGHHDDPAALFDAQGRAGSRPERGGEDQIRLIVRTLKERLFTEIFPGRTQVPKTLIFAKDGSGCQCHYHRLPSNLES